MGSRRDCLVSERVTPRSYTVGMTGVILTDVKTAISLPDPLFRRAEEAARKLGIARSQLYALALVKYLDAHSAEQVTSALDQVYADADSSLDLPAAAAQAQTIDMDEW